jgi:hypothetical protein
VLVQGTISPQTPARSTFGAHAVAHATKVSSPNTRSRATRGTHTVSPTVAFVQDSQVAEISPILAPISPVQQQPRSTSAPPRSNHTPKTKPMYFASEAPGTSYRQLSPTKSKNKSPRRMSPTRTKSWDLSSSTANRDTAQHIQAWLHQQAQETPRGEGDSGMQSHNQEGQPSSPKLLSARSPIMSYMDTNDTNGWIVSPAPPSSMTKSPAWPRTRHDRSGI